MPSVRRVRLTPYLASMGYTQEDIDWMVEHEGLELTNGGGWNEAARESVMDHMLNRNPMKDPEVVQKAIRTKIEKYGTACLRGPITEEEKLKISQRMKTNNPMHRFPEKNHTAKPITILWMDGSETEYEYMRAASNETGIPYATLKYLKRFKTSSNKHQIEMLKDKETGIKM